MEDLEASALVPQTDPGNDPYWGHTNNSGLMGYETLVYDVTEAKWKPRPPPPSDKKCYIMDLPLNVREIITKKAAHMTFTDPMNMYIAKWREHVNMNSDLIEIGSNEATKALLWLADVVKLHVEAIYGNIQSDSFGQDLCPYRYKLGSHSSRRRLTNYRASYMSRDAGYPFGWLYDNWQRNRTDIVVWMHEMIALRSRVSMSAQRVRFLQYHIDEIDRQFRRVREMVEGLSLVEGDYLPTLAFRKNRSNLRVISTTEERSEHNMNTETTDDIRKMLEWVPKAGQRVLRQKRETSTSWVATGRSDLAGKIPEVARRFEMLDLSHDFWKQYLVHEIRATAPPGRAGKIEWLPSYQLIPEK